MKMIDFLEMIFPRHNDANSRTRVKERLQLVLAHDRATVTPEIINSMRSEILEVVARYVDIDLEEMEFGLENSDRITTLIANLPIRQVKRGKVIAKAEKASETKKGIDKFKDDFLEL